MKQQLVGALAVIAASSVAMGQDAVQWRVPDGGNGHWYQLRLRSGSSWTQISADSVSNGGYLATMTGQNERGLIVSVMDGNTCAIGGFQSAAGSEPDGGWGWLTGEPMHWTNWAIGEPNNTDSYSNQTENVMGCFADGRWVDLANHLQWTSHYIIEWSADCNSDGIVDFGQIRDGTLADTDANNIPDCCEGGPNCGPCAADVVQDGVVNGVDLAAVINAWGTDGGKLPRADIDGSGLVDGSDLAQVLGNWGPCN